MRPPGSCVAMYYKPVCSGDSAGDPSILVPGNEHRAGSLLGHPAFPGSLEGLVSQPECRLCVSAL